MRNLHPAQFIFFQRNPIPILSCILILFFIVPHSVAETTVGGTISTDTTWTLSGSPYIVTSNIFVKGIDGADGITTLTIEAGVEIRFNINRLLKVGASSGDPGALRAQGTAADPIIFTANQSAPLPGKWRNITFDNTTDDNQTILEHCTVQYAGYGNLGQVYVRNSAPIISNCTFANSSNYDLFYKDTVGGTVSGCTLNSGIYLLAAGMVDFTGNIFNQNNNCPTKTYADLVGSIVSGNTFNNLDENSSLMVSTGTISHDATWTSSIPYLITGNITVKGTDGADAITTLNIDPGSKLLFDGNRQFIVGASSGDPGALRAQGTAADPIIFTSSHGSPSPGNWSGIRIYDTADDATTLMEHCVVDYGGYSSGSLYAYKASPTFRNVTVQNSKTYGAYLYYAEPTIENSIFEGNLNYDIYFRGSAGGSVTGTMINSGVCQVSAGMVNFSGNTINQNDALPITIYADNVGELLTSTIHNVDTTSYLKVSSGNVTRDATWTSVMPIDIQSDLTVQGTDGADGVTSLTIEPGAKLKIRTGRDINIGSATGDPGALIAQGTSENMILFTSNKPAPVPGDWLGITFAAKASENSLLDYCVIEYGGYGGRTLYINNRNISVRNSIIRNNAGLALQVAGTNCSGANIRCNTFEGNQTGIYLTGNAMPIIKDNNFIDNTYCGLRSYGYSIIAENNWWNNINGPNQGGDITMGDVDADPWSTEKIQCSSDSANSPPYVPSAPSPMDNAVRVSSNTPITLTWAGGDPNHQDTVVYDIYIGTASDTLTLNGQGVSGASYAINEPTPGITYYWQVKARDNHGEEATSPIWRFTAKGERPDLTIGNVITEPPGNLQVGQNITITATIHNNGAGPMVDNFVVDFNVDGTSIGTPDVTEIILAGQSVALSVPWSYSGGNPVVEIRADSQLAVIETDERNNTYTSPLNDIADMTAPAITNTAPENAAYLQQVNNIAVTLVDTQSAVDDTAVISTFNIIDSSQQSVSGVVSEENNIFTFAPNTSPMTDGTYTISLVAADIHGNTQNHSFVFTVDSQAPAKPVITGGTVSSGIIQARPVQNTSDQFIVELTGTREADTAVLINGVQRLGLGDLPWSIQVQLQPDDNTLEAKLMDRAGNIGEAEWIDIFIITSNSIQFEYDAAGRVKSIDADQ